MAFKGSKATFCTHLSSAKQFYESGRSMVEMLGVLAIMGILGLTGVWAYNAAMNRHHANELIYEAQKRATVVAMQITAGNATLSIGEFKNPAGYTFGVEKNPNNANQFNITLTGVDTAVCGKMKDFAGKGSQIRMISESCDKLTYNNDLSSTFCASDYPTREACTQAGLTWCGGTGACSEVGCCDAHQDLPPCQVCNQGAIVTGPKEGAACTYQEAGENKTGMCHLGQCQALPSNVTCDANTGLCTCTNGGTLCNRETGLCCLPREGAALSQLCNSGGDVNTPYAPDQAKCLTLTGECSTNSDCSGDTPWCRITEYTDCHTPTKGTCTALGSSETLSVYGLGEVLIGPDVNWWSAKNWCEANGKHLVNVEDFQVYHSNGRILQTTGTNPISNACRQGKTCTWWTSAYAANAMWAGDSGTAQRTLTDARDANGELYSEKYSPVVLDLATKQRGIRHTFWTASDYTRDSCGAFYVDMDYGHVAGLDHSSDASALCE